MKAFSNSIMNLVEMSFPKTKTTEDAPGCQLASMADDLVCQESTGFDLQQLDSERQRLAMIAQSARAEVDQLARRNQQVAFSLHHDEIVDRLRQFCDRSLTRDGGYVLGICLAVGLLSIMLSLIGIPAPLALLGGLGAGGYVAWKGRDLYQPSDETLRSRILKNRQQREAIEPQLAERQRYAQRASELAQAAEQRWQEATSRYRTSTSVFSQLPWHEMTGREFEDYLTVGFRILGYSIEPMRLTRHQGVDLIVNRKGTSYAIRIVGQPDAMISNAPVQEVYAGCHFYQLDVPVVITNGRFSSTAYVLSKEIGCLLIDRSKLPDFLETPPRA